MFKIRSRAQLIKKVLLFCFAIRLVGSLVRAISDVAQPHVWRQLDTLGVSYRYWVRWIHEHGSSGYFLPAVLQGGDGNGIMPMEFPFLNFIFFPFWFFGPFWGKVIIFTLLALLIYWLCWQLMKTKLWFSSAFLLLPTFSYSADYIDKFMPDAMAMLLVSWGVVFAVKNKKLLAFFCATLGLLMKPPVVVAFSILFFTPRFKKRFTNHLTWLIPSVVVAVLYYTYGIKFIDQFRVGDLSLFTVSARDPISSLVAALSLKGLVFNQIVNRMFMVAGLWAIAAGIVFIKIKKMKPLILLFIVTLFLQFLTIAALDGTHLSEHDYYCMGIAPIAAMFFYFVLRKTSKVYSYILLLVIAAHALELSVQNLSFKKLAGYYSTTKECAQLIQRNPQIPWNTGYVFRANYQPYPALGLCFGERQGSQTAEYGFFYTSTENEIPTDCKVSDRSETYLLVHCRLSL